VLIAILSDTHIPRGRRTLPVRCVERLRAADLILHAGDLTSMAFLDELRAIGPPVEAVVGNVDEPALHELLPVERVVEAGDVRIGMVHIGGSSAGRAERLVARFPGCAAVVYGHSHLPEVTRHGDVWILNPGSPTERRRAPFPSMIAVVVTNHVLQPTLVDLGLE
jgi:putative phosphoesterase